MLACAIVTLAAGAWPRSASAAEVRLTDAALDKPLVLNEETEYVLRNVQVTGLTDCAAITLAGRIRSVTLDGCTFGQVWTGLEGRAAGLECAGAMIGSLVARDTTFFDAENQLASLKDGSFGKVTFERCRFYATESFLKRIYTDNPWRTTPPVTEFYNIARLELLDNEYSNTLVVIHPSVKQVVIRGDLPGLKVQDEHETEVIRLNPGQAPDDVAPATGLVAQISSALGRGSPADPSFVAADRRAAPARSC
jgi:hypothetical protein